MGVDSANRTLERICLGTAQFGMAYGVANTTGRIRPNEVQQILDEAREAGIRHLDTAQGYGESERVIGAYLQDHSGWFRVMTKVSPGVTAEDPTLRCLVFRSRDTLRVDRLEGVLLHRFQDFIDRPSLWDELTELKAEGVVGTVGFSLYSPIECEHLFQKGIRPDVIQVPYSLFDRRFEACFGQAASVGVKIHARSVFLQGLAYLDPDCLPGHLCPARHTLKQLRGIAFSSGISISALCLNYVLLNPLVDRVVIGIDSMEHLNANVRHLSEGDRVAGFKVELDQLAIQDEDVLLPYRWGG